MSTPPPSSVLRAFGAVGPVSPLEGGRGDAWRCGDLVLKPADADGDATRAWLDAEVRPRAAADLRIAFPARALDGSLRVAGWEATRWLAGAHPAGRWCERAEVARRFARALEGIDPASLPRRDDPWAAADRAAWGEEAGPLDGHPLHRAVRPSALPIRIVHGDLAGNTLLHDELAPAVIDLSLYARPAEWAVAVLAVDVIAFEGAPLDLVASIGTDPRFLELVARALLFRMTTDVLLGGSPHAAFAPLTGVVLSRIV